MRLTVFGASGGTGRQLVRQALEAGHQIVAATRHPAEFPVTHPRLLVAEADVRDGHAVTRAVEGSDAVVSILGVPFTLRPVTVYSEGVANIAVAMSQLGSKRIVAVSSSAVAPHHHADGGFILNHVVQPVIARTIGKTTYADLQAMEAILGASNLDWTVVRAAGLFDGGRVSAYRVSDRPLDGLYTSRADLAACLLAQVSDQRFLNSTIEINTTEETPTLWRVIRREAFKQG